MSTNCISCINKERTGSDMLCDSCREKGHIGPLITDARVGCAIANLPKMLAQKYMGMVLWAAVSKLFGFGSTYSIALCKKHGFDPHKIIVRG